MSNPLERRGIHPIEDPTFAKWMKQMQEDAGWFLTQPEHLERYHGMVVVLHNRIVVGTGRDHLEAMEDVRQRAVQQQRQLPPSSELLAVPIVEHPWVEKGFAPPVRQSGANGAVPGSTES